MSGSSINSNTVVLTGDGSKTAFVVPHGCRGVPAAFHCRGLGTAANNAEPIKVTAVDATNASLSFGTAPASGAASVMFTACG